MTFEEKFNESLLNFNNTGKPDYTRNNLNLYADFVELIALFSNQDATSFGDVNDRFFGTKDYDNAEQRDEDENWLTQVFSIIEERVNLFSHNYPFTFDSTLFLLKIRDEFLWKNKLYLGMLISSKLSIFKKFSSDLTTGFETVSFHVLKNYLPSHSIVKEFGKNSEYRGSAKVKIKNLADDIGIDLNKYEWKQISEGNNQERGLDLIGWTPFDDNCMNKLIYLGQCTCGKNYEYKHHDTRRFQEYLSFYKTQPQHVLFIPYSLINTSEKKFYNSDLIEKNFLIFERKRLLDFFQEESVFANMEMLRIVDRCIIYEQDIV